MSLHYRPIGIYFLGMVFLTLPNVGLCVEQARRIIANKGCTALEANDDIEVSIQGISIFAEKNNIHILTNSNTKDCGYELNDVKYGRKKRLVGAYTDIELMSVMKEFFQIGSESTTYRQDAANEVAAIRALYAAANKTIDESKTQEVLYYTAKDGWKKAVNPKVSRFDDVDRESLFEKAYVYVQQGRVIKSVMVTVTPSGDWQNSREYYFYDNGKTAFVFEKHLTFLGYDYDTKKPLPNGPFIIEKRIYFDANGKEIRRLEKASASKSRQEVAIQYLKQADLDLYKDIASFPFHGVFLKTKN